MVQATKADAPDVFAAGESVKADLRRLEKFPQPVVAAINGAALGGGLEICLACNHRIVVDDPKVEVGLPEATLGLLPGGGGVTRIVRMLGIQSALMDVLLAGHPVQAGPGAGEGPGRRAGRHPRGAGAGREGLDQGQPRRRPEPVGPAGLQDARRHAQQPQAGGVPAGVPGAAAPADQGRGLPGPAGDPVRRGRGRPGRLRHRLADRVALPDQPDRQPELEEHDPGVLLRPAGDQLRVAAARRASRRTRPSRSASSAPA